MTTKKDILRAIRLNCLNCCGYFIPEVKNCAVGTKCTLYPFRMGTDPYPARKFHNRSTQDSEPDLNGVLDSIDGSDERD